MLEDILKTIFKDAVREVMLELKEAEPKEETPEIDEWLDQQGVCKLLKVSKSTIVNWRNSGKLKSHKIGNRILFKREEILAKIKELRPFRSVEL